MKGTLRLFRICVATATLAAFTPAFSTFAADREKAQTRASASASSHKVNVNTATKAELESLPGIGPATADAIIAARPFRSVAELKNVKGIGESRMEDLIGKVTVRDQASRGRSQATGGPGSSTSATLSGGEKPGPEARNRDRTQGEPADASLGTPGPGSGKPAAEAQERNRKPENAEKESNFGSPTTPGSGTTKPSAEAREKDRARNSEHAMVNLNTASREDLEALPGIGPVKAQAIIDNRPYNSIEDVKKVNGIKEGTFDQIKDRITVR